MKKKAIVLISAGQPSTNPRLVKEAICLYSAGYNVTVFYSFWAIWADKPDIEIKKEYPGINWVRIGGHPKEQRFKYLNSRFVFKIFRYFNNFLPLEYIKINAINRTSYALHKKVRMVKASLYIAHGLGALPATIKAAQKNNSKAGIDFEDHYSGQWEKHSKNYKEYKWIEDKFIPEVSFCTAASPLIAAKYKNDYPYLTPVTINNVFSKMHLQSSLRPHNQDDTLKLFWFSQTVGKGRGIEEIIKAIGKLNGDISCTVLGSCDMKMKTELLHIANENGVNENQINFLDPVSPGEIFSIAARHHIGLALESEGTINRDICLTNKIFTYLLSGLAIIATDTSAQKLFLEIHKGVGYYFQKGNVNNLAELILGYQNNPDLLKQHRSNALKLAAETMNWEEEQKQFLSLIEQQLS